MEPFTETDLLAALRDCFIPSPLPSRRRDVVAAALVRSADLLPDCQAPGSGIPGVPPRFVAHVRVTAPGTDESVNAQLRATIENRLLGLPAISRAVVTVVPPLFPILG